MYTHVCINKYTYRLVYVWLHNTIMYTFMYIYIYTHIYTYTFIMSTYIRAYLHAYKTYMYHRYIHMYIHAYRLPDLCSCTQTYMHVYKHVHTYMETDACLLWIYRHLCLPSNLHACIDTHIYANPHVCLSTYMHANRYMKKMYDWNGHLVAMCYYTGRFSGKVRDFENPQCQSARFLIAMGNNFLEPFYD